MQNLRSIFAATLLALCCAGLVFSQAVNGSLLGTITDSSGAAVPNAKVTIVETRTAVSRTANKLFVTGYSYGTSSYTDYATIAYHG